MQSNDSRSFETPEAIARARGPRMNAAAFDLGQRDGFTGVDRSPYAPLTIENWSYWAGRIEGKADRAMLAKCVREANDRSMMREFGKAATAGNAPADRAPPAS